MTVEDPKQPQHEEVEERQAPRSAWMTGLQLAVGALFLVGAISTHLRSNGDAAAVQVESTHRRLLETTSTPSYVEPLMKDLKERKKLMEETPPEEVKYWFEYTGPLQVRIFWAYCSHELELIQGK